MLVKSQCWCIMTVHRQIAKTIPQNKSQKSMISPWNNKLNGGSRYWKGSIKRGVSIMRQGVKSLNTARGKTSVIGSSISGGASILKTGIYAILGR